MNPKIALDELSCGSVHYPDGRSPNIALGELSCGSVPFVAITLASLVVAETCDENQPCGLYGADGTYSAPFDQTWPVWR